MPLYNTSAPLPQIPTASYHVGSGEWSGTRTLIIAISCISITVLLAVGWKVYATFLRGRAEPDLTGSGAAARSVGVPSDLFSKLKLTSFRALTPSTVAAEEESSSLTCSVCLSDYCAGDSIRELPCGHKYHRGCIELWLATHTTCPLCCDDVLRRIRGVPRLPRYCISTIPACAVTVGHHDSGSSTLSDPHDHEDSILSGSTHSHSGSDHSQASHQLFSRGQLSAGGTAPTSALSTANDDSCVVHIPALPDATPDVEHVSSLPGQVGTPAHNTQSTCMHDDEEVVLASSSAICLPQCCRLPVSVDGDGCSTSEGEAPQQQGSVQAVMIRGSGDLEDGC